MVSIRSSCSTLEAKPDSTWQSMTSRSGAIMARSFLAGALLVLIAMAANFLGFAYLNQNAIGLTTDTISVISLGMGLGLCFAVYLLAGIQDAMAAGLELDDAVRYAIHGAGRWVIATFLVIVAGLAPWALSPLLF